MKVFASTSVLSYTEYQACLVQALAYNENKVEALVLPPVLKKFSNWISELSEVLKKDGLSIVKALSTKPVYSIFKAFRFDMSTMIKCLKAVSSLGINALKQAFHRLEQTNVVTKLKSGVLKIDQVLDQYPLLKKITSVALAGVLLYMWINMAFVGSISYDFDLSDVVDALAGKFTLSTFLTERGMLTTFLFLLGASTGLTFPYLLSTPISLLAAIAYTGFKRIRDTDSMARLKEWFK